MWGIDTVAATAVTCLIVGTRFGYILGRKYSLSGHLGVNLKFVVRRRDASKRVIWSVNVAPLKLLVTFGQE